MRLLAILQGGYFLFAGIWPLISIETFQRVTGPKTDLWLVKTVGALVLAIAAVILRSALARRPAPEAMWLAVGSASALATIDSFYSMRGRISRIYLADALAEIGLLGLLLLPTTGRHDCFQARQ